MSQSYVDVDLLDRKIKESGLRVSYFVERLDTTRGTFIRKRNGEVAFTIAEMYIMIDILHLTVIERDAIFRPKCL